MNELELIKQAYAYGAAIALQEAGIEKNAADELATKLAENGLTDLQAGISQLSPLEAAQSPVIPSNKRDAVYDAMVRNEATGGLKGLLAGGAGGAGLGALLGLLNRRRGPLSSISPGLGALIGGGAGALSGGAIGEGMGRTKGLEEGLYGK